MVETIPDAALVVVADGAKATLFRTRHASDGVSLQKEDCLSRQSHDDDSSSGSRPEEQTSSQTDEATFAKQLAHRLYAMHHRGDCRSLVLAADPQTLGQLRGCMHKAVEGSLVRTVAKNLTNLPIPGITAALGR